jgi:hypothetical protein
MDMTYAVIMRWTKIIECLVLISSRYGELRMKRKRNRFAWAL